MARQIHSDRLNAILVRALASGARRKSVTTVEWSIAGDCYAPYLTVIEGRAELPHRQRTMVLGMGTGRPVSQWLELWTRCRKCERCLRARARRWFGAAVAETKASSRTWFGTLTLSPEEHFRALSVARHKIAQQGIDFDTLEGEDQFLLRHSAIGPELTKYIKRVRKESGARLRYLLVAERHVSGLPHYHMLVHEAPLHGIVSHRTLSTQWHMGFERWRLVPPESPKKAGYLCKYLSKSMSARVRASQRYGVATSDLHTYVIAQLRKVGREPPSEPDW